MKKILTLLCCLLFLLSSLSAAAQQTITTEPKTEEKTLLIITPFYFKDLITPLIEHKNDHGIETILQTTHQIYQSYQGRDRAEQIKYAIKDAKETHNISYVLLIGGRVGQTFFWHIPPRYVHTDDKYSQKMFLSDLYYADLYDDQGTFCSWDSDDNGKYSEFTGGFPKDDLDLIPDVAVGRLPCRNRAEVKAIVQKIIDYETTPPPQEDFHTLLLIGGDTNPGVGDPFPWEGEACCDYTATLLPDFTPKKLYTSDQTLSGPQDFITAYNQGAGFVLYHGHGLQSLMATYLPDDPLHMATVFSEDYLDELANPTYPITLVGCCLTTDFDSGLYNFLQLRQNEEQYYNTNAANSERVSACIGWKMVRLPDTGSIAHLGSSSTAWGSTGDGNQDGIPDSAQYGYTSGICTEFFKAYGQGQSNILGELLNIALETVGSEFSAHRNRVQAKCIQEFQLIGDPSLQIGGYQ